jgi:hypothetical protein
VSRVAEDWEVVWAMSRGSSSLICTEYQSHHGGDWGEEMEKIPQSSDLVIGARSLDFCVKSHYQKKYHLKILLS